MSDLVKRLRDKAEKLAEDRRVGEYGPGGGNPDAKAEQHLEWLAADRIEELQAAAMANADAAKMAEMHRDHLQRKYEATRGGLEDALYMLGVIDLDGNVTPEYHDPDPDAMKPGVRRAIRALLETDNDA